MSASTKYTAFIGDRIVATGSLREVALAISAAGDATTALVFDNTTGAQTDLGSDTSREPTTDEPRGRGRPKLGVVAREVTLLPRHWDWLSRQPGGASVALRKLVEEASRAPKHRARTAANAAYSFMHAIAGDRPGYEEALRALFAGDRPAFEANIGSWPIDVRAFAVRLAFPEQMS